ncbi:MAG: hypothetical protein LBI11_03875, partial [Streptococcaceae bacterium]|nr:hypothetical protein [Streptococcaceae bacterium]
MVEEVGNFQEGIHATNYWNNYLSNKFQNSDIALYGREVESLNGKWQYGIDQYDTCLRQKWWEEHYFDEEGRAFPIDWSFDTWENMSVPSNWNMYDE